MSGSAKNSAQNLQLVNYYSGDSSSDEDLERSSPRKRRKGRKSTLELDEFLGPLDLNGFLKVETLFSDDYNWFEPLKVKDQFYLIKKNLIGDL